MSTQTTVKHTPGPWLDGQIIRNEQLNINVASVHSTDDSGGPSVPIGGSWGGTTPSWEQSLANARLIAAAPELLGALERVVAGAGYTSGQAEPETLRKNGMGLNVPVMYLDQARAAIAKATGE